jgi:hypothetical protein
MDRPAPPRARRDSTPWLRNKRWSTGAIRDQSAENLLMVWVFTLLWNLVTALALIPRVKEGIHGHDKARWLALAFPAIGLGLFIWAARRTWRIRKFGPSVFHLQTLPATPGGDLAGTIHVARKFPADSGILLKLVCNNRSVEGFGRRARVIDRLVWNESQTLDYLPECREGTDIPVLFHIPPDAKCTSELALGDGVRWKLQVRCKTGGVSYYSLFEVPVFLAEPMAVAVPAESSDPRSKLGERGIVCERTGGHLQIHFARGVFGFKAVSRWFTSAQITVRYGSLTVSRESPIFSQEQTYKIADVANVYRESHGIRHRLVLETRDGDTICLATGIRQRDYAEWLADEIKETIGLAAGG